MDPEIEFVIEKIDEFYDEFKKWARESDVKIKARRARVASLQITRLLKEYRTLSMRL